MAAALVLVVAGPWDWLIVTAAVLVALGLLAWRLKGAAIVRRRLGRPEHRGRIEVSGGSPWPWDLDGWLWRRRAFIDLRRVVREWGWIASRAGIPEARLTAAIADEREGYSFRVNAAGWSAGDVDILRLHSALQLPCRLVVTTPDVLRPWEWLLVEVTEVA